MHLPLETLPLVETMLPLEVMTPPLVMTNLPLMHQLLMHLLLTHLQMTHPLEVTMPPLVVMSEHQTEFAPGTITEVQNNEKTILPSMECRINGWAP